MRKRFLIFLLFVFALCSVMSAGEKRIAGTRINNQVMLLRIDLANYAMEASADGVNWSAIPGTSGEFIINDNDLSLAKLVRIPTASVLGNTSGSTGNVTALSASDIKTLIGNASSSVAGLMAASDKTKLDSGVAASGANSDIASLTGLTTPLSVAQGGTGAATAANARTSLSAASLGANSDITSLTGLTTALSVSQGGTGAATASGARTGLGAAASGANSDITSLTGLTTALSIAQGGTGLSVLGTAGQVITVNSGATGLEFATISTTPTWASITGKPIDLTSYGASYDGHSVRFRYTSGGGIDENAKLMLHFDNNVTDSSSSAVTVTAYNSPAYSTGVFSQAITFDGSTQYLSFPAPFTTPPAGFTIEFRLKASTPANQPALMYFGTSGGTEGGLVLNTDGTLYFMVLQTSVSTSFSVCDGTWHSICISGSVTAAKLFVDGVLIGTANMRADFTFPSEWRIARPPDGWNSMPYGAFSIDELRISNVARYTSGYTPAASAYSTDAVIREMFVDEVPDTPVVASSETTVSDSCTADWDTATVHRIKTTASTACALTVQDIPVGRELTVRVDNTAAGSVTFGGDTVVTTGQASVVFLTFINVTGTIEQKK